MQQELLTTFEEEIGELSLKPSDESGVFDIFLNDQLIFSRRANGRFPDIKELKKLLRDQIAPHKSLGHSES